MNDWLSAFKFAVITNNFTKCQELVDTFDAVVFSSKEQLEEAAALTQEAIALFETEKLKLGSELAKLKRTKKYLASHAS